MPLRRDEVGVSEPGESGTADEQDLDRVAFVNTVSVADEEAVRESLSECIRDPDRELIDVPECPSTFATSFSREFQDARH